MSDEFQKKGANIMLAPGIGIARVPTAGRNFEYLCGEDPTLGSIIVKDVVKGFQANGMVANAKHFINNEIEDHRQLVSSNVDERVRRELYYPPFEAASDAGVLSVMCAYNRVNDVHACQNNETLADLKQMGFKGWVMSDWMATHSTTQSLKAGLDQEMPFGLHFSQKSLKSKLEAGEISETDIDNSVLRILTAMYTSGMFDRPVSGDPLANVTSDSHNALAREIAAKSAVLLKNEGSVLPLDSSNLGDCIAVFGDEKTVSGGGSGHVNPAYVITPKDGIAAALAKVGSSTKVIYNSGSDLSAAQSLAQQCNTAVVVVATNACEGSDRKDLSLGDEQNALVSTVAANNKRTIVAVNTPGAVLLPFTSEVSAMLINWLPGQEAGNALADVLFGLVNPSGRLSVTLPNKENEVGFSKRQYPGIGFPPEAYYTEELLIGYRWYDANDVNPLYPFGHGLSYTTFDYQAISGKFNRISSKVKSDRAAETVGTVSLTITNTGKFEGAEVAQLYVQYPKLAQEPPKQLRNFQKISLKPNESKVVQFTVTDRDIAIWNSDADAWEVKSGVYNFFVGASSRDIRLTTSLTVTA